ncbi:MAG: lysyl-tRNA synthetase, class [Patescibacteria group bacterium]|nr:lysyl-tRNA synthetase, class [Patescibacteria group bacterium]
MSEQTSKYWLHAILDEIDARAKSGRILVSSGITPSGPYHVGHAREILTAEAVRRGLESRGREALHIHNVDDSDALRKRYPYLPESFEKEVGKPVYLVPAPDGSTQSYADYYFSEYAAAARKLEIPMEIWRSHEEYGRGVFADAIVTALTRRDDIAKILAHVSQREVPADWQPIQILDITTKSLRTAEFLGFDAATYTVEYRAADGAVHQADMRSGEVKLDWRVDWPARWAILGVDVEGFGKEHATKGGSYETGAAIVREIFDAEPPIAVPFNPINLKGDNQKMSSSLGNLVTIADALEVIPPDILRYFVFKSLPQKVLAFDPGVGMGQLIDEYAATEAAVRSGQSTAFKDAWEVSVLDQDHATVSTVPFTHLATVYQTAQGDSERVLELLTRTGHAQAVREDASVIERELKYVAAWLERFAPESSKFSVLLEAPEVTLQSTQKDFIVALVEKLADGAWEGDVLQAEIFAAAQQVALAPKEAFSTLYQLFIGKTAGPKLGPFLASQDRDFVLTRLNAYL